VAADAGTKGPEIGRLHPANLRAAWWALGASRRTRRLLEHDGLEAALAPPPPPELPAAAERGVRAVLRRRGDSCVVRSIVLQSWLAAHGDPHDLIVGVTGPGDDFAAHAWLEGEPAHGDTEFTELLRRPAPTTSSGGAPATRT
jgi:hypothetical protein